MNKKLITAGALAGVLLAGTAAGLAWADTKAGPVTLTEQQAIEIALAEVPGEVLETELETDDGSRIYEIEIRNADGVEMEVEVHAETGMVLEIEAEDDYDDDDDDDDSESDS